MKIATVVLLLLAPAATYAQTDKSSIFVEGAVLGDRDPTHDRSHIGFAPGGSATVGFHLSQRFSVRFEAEIPARDIRTDDYVLPGVFAAHEVWATRTITCGGMFGWHVWPAGNHVELSFLAGLSSVAPETNVSSTFDTLAKDGSIVRRDSATWHYFALGAALTYGMDVAVPMGKHLSVVPEVRFHGYSAGVITRPKLAFRWTF